MRRVICALFFTLALLAQQQPNVDVQRQAMKKLELLVGKWSVTAIVVRGSSKPLKLTQTEDVQFEPDGLRLLIERTGHSTGGQAVSGALALSYDKRDRAHGSDGHDICRS